MFFQLLSTIKVKLVDEMMHSAYLCVILRVKHKKLSFLAVLPFFPIQFKDGDHSLVTSQASNSAPTHKIYTSFCWEDQRLSTEGKIVSRYCNISKSLGRGSINPLLFCGGGLIRVYVQGLRHHLAVWHDICLLASPSLQQAPWPMLHLMSNAFNVQCFQHGRLCKLYTWERWIW